MVPSGSDPGARPIERNLFQGPRDVAPGEWQRAQAIPGAVEDLDGPRLRAEDRLFRDPRTVRADGDVREPNRRDGTPPDRRRTGPGQVPGPNRTVLGESTQAPPVRAERNGQDARRVALQDRPLPTRGDVPDRHGRTVAVVGGERGAVRAELHPAENTTPAEGAQLFPGGRVPDPDALAAQRRARCRHPFAVGTEHDMFDRFPAGRLEHQEFLAGGHVPDLDPVRRPDVARAVERHDSGRTRAVGAERRPRSDVAEGQGEQGLPRGHVPDVELRRCRGIDRRAATAVHRKNHGEYAGPVRAQGYPGPLFRSTPGHGDRRHVRAVGGVADAQVERLGLPPGARKAEDRDPAAVRTQVVGVAALLPVGQEDGEPLDAGGRVPHLEFEAVPLRDESGQPAAGAVEHGGS